MVTRASAKRKGSGYENAVVTFLRGNGFPFAERRLAGATLDRGDVAGIPGLVVECKNHARMQIGDWVTELTQEMRNDPHCRTGVVIHKKRGTTDVGDHYATMPVSVWLDLYKRANRTEKEDP